MVVHADEDLTHNAIFDSYTREWGIDVSRYQYSIDWEEVKADGIDFVIIKLGGRGSKEGTNTVDPYFITNITGAYKAGVKVGVYFFTQAISTDEAVEEAAFTIKTLAPYKEYISMPVYYDIENLANGRMDNAKLNKENRTELCKAFCNEIQDAGYRAGIYSNASYLKNNLIMSQLEPNYEVWLANYTLKTTYAGKYNIWQYSDNDPAKTTIVQKGIEGIVKDNGDYRAVDLDVYYSKDYANVLCPESTIAALEYSQANSDGFPKTPAVTVKYGPTLLTQNVDYTVTYTNNVLDGQATVTISGMGLYTGTIVRTFTIGKKNLSKAEIKFEETSFIADGLPKTPNPTVTYDGFALLNGIDYTVTYANNVEAGTATATITGIGNYTGTVNKDFNIVATLDNAVITLDTTIFQYDGNAKKPGVIVTNNGVQLVNKTDYIVTYNNNKAAGNATVTIVGKGKYTGSKSASFAILSYDAKMPSTYKQAFIYKNVVYGIADMSKDVATAACLSNKTVTSVSIPATVKINGLSYRVTTIKKKTFYKAASLKKITIGKNVAKINDSAFEGCKKLTTVKFGANVKNIGNSAFKNCTGLKSVSIPAKLETIGKNAFNGCKKLKTITIKSEEDLDIKSNAFKGISLYATFKVPGDYVEDYKEYLTKKTGFKKTMKIKKK